MQITLSPSELFDLIYGDDSLTKERAWIERNTVAAGYCRVVKEDLGLLFLANDPAEAYAHVEVYETNTELGRIFTLWRPFEWNDSTEKRRLLKARSSEWRIKRDSQLQCEMLVEEFIRNYGQSIDATSKALAPLRQSLICKAQEVDFNPEFFRGFLIDLGMKFSRQFIS